MQARWKLLFVLALIVLVIGLLVIGNAQLNQDPQTKGTSPQAQEVDTTKFPFVDYNAPLPSDPTECAKREAKSKKYNSRNSRYDPPITESTDRVFHSDDWDVGLPAIPVARSSAVIIGEITQAQAHLSEDKTTVYSEFIVSIESILKDEAKMPLSVGNSVAVERLGGRVRFPSGKIMTYWVSHQDMPVPGSRYVLFLTHDAPMGGVWDDSLFVLTGYELRAGKVFPLDKTNPGHPIMKYKGADETSHLRDLTSALPLL